MGLTYCPSVPSAGQWGLHTVDVEVNIECHRSASILKGYQYRGIWDLSKVYQPELLEHVSAGEVLEADSNLSSCINFTVFSFVTAYNLYKNVGGLHGCNFTFCVKPAPSILQIPNI